MKKISARELDVQRFAVYGCFARMIDPDWPRIGEEPLEFYRDMLQLDLGGSSVASFSICRVCPRPGVVDVTEFHDSTGEGILPLDGDVIIHVGPATAGGRVPLEDIEAYTVPAGTMVVLRPGVWHHGPFAAGKSPVNVLIVLPERTYSIDCKVTALEPADRIEIEQPAGPAKPRS